MKKKCIFNLVRKNIPISTLKTHFYINCMISSNYVLQNEEEKRNGISGKKISKKQSCDVEFLP